MADAADLASEAINMQEQAGVDTARAQAASMPTGTPGECELCGRWSGRLVLGTCAPCRDKYNLK